MSPEVHWLASQISKGQKDLHQRGQGILTGVLHCFLKSRQVQIEHEVQLEHTVQSYIPIKDGTGCLTGSHCRWATQWLANK
jgi:hypothetical protein